MQDVAQGASQGVAQDALQDVVQDASQDVAQDASQGVILTKFLSEIDSRTKPNLNGVIVFNFHSV